MLNGPAGGDPFVLVPPHSKQVNPFWVVGATKEVIDGHGGILQQPFLAFLASIIFRHVHESKRREATAFIAEAAPNRDVPEELATLARNIGPIPIPLE
jgi:hypothetical protein